MGIKIVKKNKPKKKITREEMLEALSNNSVSGVSLGTGPEGKKIVRGVTAQGDTVVAPFTHPTKKKKKNIVIVGEEKEGM